MSDEVYYKLVETLNTIPNGFPTTESRIEIKLLKKIFSPEQADLFCDLRLSWETTEQIAERTGRPLEGLEEKLIAMNERGQIQAVPLGDIMMFRMLAWIFGIYEMQNRHLDREMAEMNEEFMPHYLKQYHSAKPQGFRVVPIEKDIPSRQEATPYEQVSKIIKDSQSFQIMSCVCKKEQGLLENKCEYPLESCMAFAPIPGAFDKNPLGRDITKEEALAALDKFEELGLVHITGNYQSGHFFLCNCCKCCCGVLQGITQLGMKAGDVVNSSYYAVIDADECTVCGICADERCHVGAIEEGDDAYEVIKEKCIGCGLCISTCPVEAMQLVRKSPEEILIPPIDQDDWFVERGKERGVDFSKYK